MKRIVTLLAVVLTLALSGVVHAKITGTSISPAGELVVLNCDREAVWTVYPANYLASFAVSDDGKTLYFASSQKGSVTFFAASVLDGLPYIEQHTIYNGVEVPDDVPDPEPAPEPKPEPVETLASIVADNVLADATADEYKALSESFSAAVSGIDRGTVKTTAGARETFRATWARKAAETNPEALANFDALLTKLSEKIDNSSLDKLKEDYTIIVTALNEVAAAKEKAAKAAAKSKKEAEAKQAPVMSGGCPNGQCPVNQYQGWRFR